MVSKYLGILRYSLDTRLLADKCWVEEYPSKQEQVLFRYLRNNMYTVAIFREDGTGVHVPRGTTAVIAAPTGSPRAGP